jgi:predicted N-acyltransferase
MQIDFVSSIHTVARDEWNALCATDYPFIRHEFFAALEDSGSTCAATGWQPHHLILRDDQQLRAAIPLFIKTHSYGEYVFDWSWADAYRRHGAAYYPKLVNAIPFTPCYGPRWLGIADPANQDYLPVLIAALTKETDALSASGWHCLFPQDEVSAELAGAGASMRLGCQFHWFNRQYKNFDDFLATMTARKRKNINKERRQVIAEGFNFVHKEGDEITPADWDFFYSLYRNTYAKRSGHTGYLTRDFFHELGRLLPTNTLMICAERAATPVAAALYLRDSTTLYGRYWGCLQEYDFLHFETCYYQGIDYAIARGLQRFDGGAQGEHKIQRGFEPVITYSNHWLAHPGFRNAIDHFLIEETAEIKNYVADAQGYLPFKRIEGKD